MVVNADGIAVADASGTAVADEDAMPIAAVDYRQPVSFIPVGLASWSSHSGPLGVHRVLPCPIAPTTTAVNNLVVH